MSRPHAAALVEDAWHRQLERGLRRRHWRNRVIGHVGYGSTDFLRIFARVVLSRAKDEELDDEEADDPTYGGLRSLEARRRGWRVFFTAPAMDVPVTISVGGHLAHARSDRSGHVDFTFRGHGLDGGWHTATVRAQGAEPVQVDVFVVADDVTYGLVSDIDDTVISTMLPRMFLAAWNTFVKHEGTRRVVPGMAPLYRQLLSEHPGAPCVYLSTGAWNTAPPLTRFLRNHGYPVGPLLLTDWGPTNTGWFRSGMEHKRSCLDRLARDFPQIRWVLVGDDGQHDLEGLQRLRRGPARAHRGGGHPSAVADRADPLARRPGADRRAVAARPGAPRGPDLLRARRVRAAADPARRGQDRARRRANAGAAAPLRPVLRRAASGSPTGPAHVRGAP